MVSLSFFCARLIFHGGKKKLSFLFCCARSLYLSRVSTRSSIWRKSLCMSFVVFLLGVLCGCMCACLRSRQSEGTRSPLSRPCGCRGTGLSRRSVLRWRTGEHVTFVPFFLRDLDPTVSLLWVGFAGCSCFLLHSLIFLCRQQDCGHYAESDGLAPAVCASQALVDCIAPSLAFAVALTPVIEKIAAARSVHSASAPTGIAPPTLVVVHTSPARP